ncbi:MAG: glycosyltransferase family 4 protein [Deltaproteobacteria bacterium]|nr:glycosyltransferase family 4 protein [Deltaproteobacteria bacterium]
MEQKVLIAAFETVPGPTSVGNRILALTDSLARAFSVDVFTLKTENLPHIEKLLGAKVFRVPAESGEIAEQVRFFRRALQRQLEGGGYDVVHFLDPFAGTTIVSLAADYGYKTVFDVSRYPTWEVRDRLPVLDRDERTIRTLKAEELTCAKAADALLFNSKVTQKYLIEQKIQRSRTFYLPGGVGLRKPRPAAAIKGSMKIVYVGDLAPWQGIGTLVTAFAKLASRRGAELTIVGPDEEHWKSNLIESARRLKAASKIRFEGPKLGEELDEIIATADVCVAPLAKTKRAIAGGLLPVKLFEYMAHGKPVVAAATPAIKSVVTDGEHAVLYNPGDPQALATALLSVAEDDELRERIGAAGRALCESEFSGSVWRKRLYDFYAQLLGVDLSEVPTEGDWNDSAASDKLMVEFKQAISDSKFKAKGLPAEKIAGADADAADTAEVTIPGADPAPHAAEPPEPREVAAVAPPPVAATKTDETGTQPTAKIPRAATDDEDTKEGTLKIKRPQMPVKGAEDEEPTDPGAKTRQP